MDFTVFSDAEMKAYAEEAQARWGEQSAWQEFAKKQKGSTPENAKDLGAGLMALFARMGALRTLPPEDDAPQAVAEAIRAYITEHFYTCAPEIFRSLGCMYVQDERMRKNIDKAGRQGTAAYAARVIDAYCSRHE